MMKRYGVLVLLIVGLLAFSSIAVALNEQKGQKKFQLPAGAIKAIKAHEVRALDVDGRPVEARIVFHHRPGHNGGPGGGGSGGGDSTCFTFISKGAKWKATEQYVLDPTNDDGMSNAFVTTVTAASLDEWDDEVTTDVFGTQDTTLVVDGIDTVAPDGKNEIMFGSIGGSGTIGVTIVWGIFSGPPRGREIVEFDTIFNDGDFNWGDATVNNSLMDYQNVATHEFGHSAGMGHPQDNCIEETMYRFGSVGETLRRDLFTGDIAGINKLY